MKIEGKRVVQSGEHVEIWKINHGEKELNEEEMVEIAKDLIMVIMDNKLSFRQAVAALNIAKESLMEVPLSAKFDKPTGLKDIASKVKFARVKAGLNQDELCEKANISRGTLSLIENGKRAKTEIINKISEVINLDIDI